MSIKTILTPHNGAKEGNPALDVAFTLSRDLGAHVHVLNVSSDPQDAVPLLGEGMSAAIIEEMLQLSEKDAEQRAARASAAFDDACTLYAINVANAPMPGGGPSAALERVTGREDEVVALKGRLSDLIVAARPDGDSHAVSMMTINAALFETGRPVMIAPPSFGVAGGTVGRKVAVSWNGSAEASRAVAAAMPLITRSESVVVLTADSDKTSSHVASDLAAYFAWHGVEAQTRALSASGGQVGAALLGECDAMGADLLVMGAYTHSRMRQLILGGVTRHILSEAQIPVLMAH